MKTLNPNDLGKTILVDECQSLRINNFLKKSRVLLKESLLTSELETLGLKIELTTSKTCFNGARIWFVCPLCNKRAGVLFYHPINQQIGCRLCLGLEYRKQRYKGMIEGNNLT